MPIIINEIKKTALYSFYILIHSRVGIAQLKLLNFSFQKPDSNLLYIGVDNEMKLGRQVDVSGIRKRQKA